MLAAAALALMVPFAFAGERDRPVAPAGEYPAIEIGRGDTQHEWPFSVERGNLTCVAIGSLKTVIFSEPWRTDVPQEFGNMTLPRSVIVSANPLALPASLEDRTLYASFDSLEVLIKRLAPFEAMGLALCARGGAEPQNREL